jgi:hypothetical protein
MTKDELESKFEDCFDDCTQSSEGGYGADTTNMNRLWKSFQPVILEYAKEQDISFMNWSLRADCPYSCSDENQWTNINDPYDSITTEQLHDKFIEQQNKP